MCLIAILLNDSQLRPGELSQCIRSVREYIRWVEEYISWECAGFIHCQNIYALLCEDEARVSKELDVVKRRT